MYSMVIVVDGEKRSITYSQYLTLFSSFNLRPPQEEVCNLDDKTVPSNDKIRLNIDIMKRSNKNSLPNAKLIEKMHPILLNNPNISVIPTRSTSSSSIPTSKTPVSTVNRVSRVPVLNPSPGRSASGDNAAQEKSNSKKIDTKETKNDAKRNASPSTSIRPKKIQKICNIETLKKDCKEKAIHSNNIDIVSDLNQSKTNQVKKTNSSNFTKTNTATSTTPNSINQVSLESTSPKLTNEKQPKIVDLNCKADSTNTNAEKEKSPKLLQDFALMYGMNVEDLSDIQIKFNYGKNKKLKCKIQDPLRIGLMMKHVCREDVTEYFSDKNESKSAEIEHKRSSPEAKDSNSKLNSNIHNNLNKTSKTQVTCHSARARPNQMMKNQQQQPCTSKHSPSSTQLSSNITQQVTLTNVSPKLQQPNKQNDLKEHRISNNNQQSTSLKHPVAISTPTTSANKQTTGDQPQPSKQQTIGNQNQGSPSNKPLVNNQQVIPNKQTISNHIQPSTSKLPLLTVTSIAKQLPVVKSPVACPLSTQDLKKCKKCKASSEDDTCTTCQMSAHLKGVTVTRIDTPGTQVVLPSSPEVSPTTDDCVQVISDDEDDMDEINFEPVILKTESQEMIKKHIDKLSLNPKLLEDKLWQKDLSADDYFKFEHCHSISIGSFTTLPASPDDLVICMHGIRMTVKNNNYDSVTIDIPIDNIVKIMMGFFADRLTTLFIYPNYLASAGIRHLLKMNDDNSNYYYNPLSKDKVKKRIMWSLELPKPEVKKLEKFLLRFKDKYKPLTVLQLNSILNKTGEAEDNSYETEIVKNKEIYENIQILQGKLDGRNISVLRISDYRMLEIDEFMNDVLMEFYLSWWYVRKLSKEEQKRSYLFSSFFYSQLTKIAASTSESKAISRHNRVKRWTRNDDIFKKDFIFIPINESYHWFMAVICFPYLSGPVNFDDGTPVDVPNDKPDRPYHAPIENVNPTADEADGKAEDPWDFDITYTTNKNPGDYETDVLNLRKENRPPIKQPCILIFDSLNGGVARARIVATLREWLAEEYKSKHNGEEKDFSPASMKGIIVKVPQQPNSVDCGLFVCHYFEKFFERPIVDYHCPITHLENWFPNDEVTKNCQKRREVQSAILDMIDEQGGLPPNVNLPGLKFSHASKSQQQRTTRNQSRYKNHKLVDEDDMEEDVDEEDYFEEDDDHENFIEDEEPDYGEEGEFNYLEDFNSDDEYPEHGDDQREYFGEMGDDNEWHEQPHHHDDNNFHSELGYEDGEIRQFPIRSNIVVDVDNIHLRNQRNCHDVSTSNLRMFRFNNIRHSLRSDHDDDNNVDNEDDDPEEEAGEDEVLEEEDDDDHNVSNQLINSKKPHFNQH